MPEISLPQGTIHYRDQGSGPTLVFIHGAFVDGRLWDPVVERLAGRARCIVPDLPLGSHRTAMRPDADLSPHGLAQLIAGVLDSLDLHDVTLIGNDTGGALCQLVVARHPERIGRLVLTDCDAFENFPPQAFMGLVWAARAHLLTAAMQPLRLRRLRRLPFAYGLLTRRPLPDAVLEGWVRPFLSDAGVRRDARKLFAGIDRGTLLDNATRLGEFDRPVLLAWAARDPFFPIEHARRLAAIFPDARVAEIADARAFVSRDQPDRLAELVDDFVQESAVAA